MRCSGCGSDKVHLRRFATLKPVCKTCFVYEFEEEVHKVIEHYSLLPTGSRVCIGVSGGKDSSALLHCLTTLKARHGYDVEFVMLAIDEGIAGYRDQSLDCVKKAQEKYGLECLILSYEDMFDGWTMDRLTKIIGAKQNCLHCGIFRRQALELGAKKLNADSIATGHNADDSVETILMNYLRGDISRLNRCCNIVTGCACPNKTKTARGRIKPFYFSCQKEVVLYCHYLQLDYFSTECPYSVSAFRGHVRSLIKEMETVDPAVLRRILISHGRPRDECPCLTENPGASSGSNCCSGCGMPSIGSDICQACTLVKKLNDKKALV